MSNVLLTGKISLGIQFSVGVLDLYALSLPRSQNVLLRDLLKLEFVVQTIEFIFYVWMVQSWGQNSLESIIRFRYYDWMITTPAMLTTLMAYLGGSESQSLSSFVEEHYEFMIQIIMLNMLMLLSGLAGEFKQIPQTQSVAIGFVPLIIYFSMIYQKFIHEKNVDPSKVSIFYYFFIIWSLYGIIAFLPAEPKNIGYNILDLFSKNLLGVVLSVMLLIKPES